MKATIFRAAHYYGASTYEVEPEVFECHYAPSLKIDADLPDGELFEACLHSMAIRASSTGQIAHFKSSMSRNGSVRRSEHGFVTVKGDGWICQFASPEVLELEKSFLKSGDYQKVVAIREPISVSHFN